MANDGTIMNGFCTWGGEVWSALPRELQRTVEVTVEDKLNGVTYPARRAVCPGCGRIVKLSLSINGGKRVPRHKERKPQETQGK